MNILYNLAIHFYSLAARLAAPFNERASLWVNGRKGWREKVKSCIKDGDRVIWIHCASLGEFEQGRPVIETIKKEMPWFKIVLTFFSPSGYEIRKNYSKADCICYLPADTVSGSAEFIDLVKPELVIFVKYEFWNNYINALSTRKIPLYLISGIFRPGQHFFRWYGSFFRRMLHSFEKIYVQDKSSAGLLSGIGINNVIVAGDTRFDRVTEIAAAAVEIPVIRAFRGEEKLFLAGSSWKPDEEIMAAYINKNPGKMKWVFAPHEIDPSNIARIEKLFSTKCVRFSAFKESDADARVLIIDNIGMLSSAYRYAYIAAVGGGFGKGIHNILEPACWGIPVLFGPNHLKFREAVELIREGGAMSYGDEGQFESIMETWTNDVNKYGTAAGISLNYVKGNTGATGIIVNEIAQKDINTKRS
jgi:3-deoxy-D-manno-octulosonic-acid transferase